MVFVDEEKVQDEQLVKDWKDAGVEVRPYGIDEVAKYIGRLRDTLKAEDEKRKVKSWTSASMSWALSKAVGPVSTALQVH